MSRLRELRLHGFKTFADPTRFAFERGVTAVIGPNGSGKSNMADAIRWVLGEQSNRSLRMRRADDVIFAGSEQRRPHGMAEAILTLDNSDRWLPLDFSEVSIGRRVYRSGESEYLLNGARVRLRDVAEVLGEGGLGATDMIVVGQGTVDAALSLRPEERRQLFEEAAGVKALQVRKNEALARLAASRENLVRIRDLIGEVRPQVRRLAQQAEHQERHAEAARRLRQIVEELHRRRETSTLELLGSATRRAAAAGAGLDEFRLQQEAARVARIGALAAFADADAHARDAAAERERIREELIRGEARLESLRTREAEIAAAVAAAHHAARDAEQRLGELESVARGTGRTAPAELGRADELEAAWRAAVERLRALDDALVAAEDRLDELRAAGAAAKREHWSIEEEVRRTRRRVDRAASERAGLEARVAASREARDSAERTVGVAEQAAGDAADAERAALARLEAVERSLVDARAALGRVRADLSERRAASAAGEAPDPRVAAGGAPGLVARLRAAGWSTLADGIALDAVQRGAVEAVLGSRLEVAVSWRGGDPAAALETSSGSVHMLAIDAPAEDGAEGGTPDARAEAREREARRTALRAMRGRQTLAEWLRLEVAPTLLRRTVLAADVASLLAGWSDLPEGWSAVTREGDVADSRGVVVLRGRADPGRRSGAHEHEARTLAQLVAEERSLAGRLEDAERELEAATRAHLSAVEERRRRERAVEDAMAALQSARRAHEWAVGALGDLEQEARAAIADQAAARDRLAALAVAPDRAAEEELDARLAVLRGEREAAAAERDAARSAWDNARRAAEGDDRRRDELLEDRARAEAARSLALSELPLQSERLAGVRAELQAAEAEVVALRGSDAQATTARREAERARDAARERLAKVDREGAGAAARLAELEAASQQAASDVSRYEEALAALRRERELAFEGIGETDESAGGEPGDRSGVCDLTDDALDAELRRTRRSLATIGSVNPFAVAEHRELAGRLAELTSQETDLERALESTDGLVRQLEAQIAERFAAAFRAIGAAFDDFARVLFAGGSASLRISDEADGASAGAIEIAVRPPGKRLQSLGSLSGGERALAGVALLFAMLSVRPVPFCVLDEVDAALDEANIGRFAEALRRLSATTDFVVVTHNRATIEMADTIYGVTMTDAAVSRVLSLRLSDVPLEAAAG